MDTMTITVTDDELVSAMRSAAMNMRTARVSFSVDDLGPTDEQEVVFISSVASVNGDGDVELSVVLAPTK